MKAAPLGLRLFLEGVEVPVISANISVAPEQPASASIQIVPTDAGLDFMPRTLVHLFALDQSGQLGAPAPRNEGGNQVEETSTLNRFEALDEQYHLAFTGEIIGYQYTKAANGRALVLQCMDLSIYWDTCYQWFADYSVGGSALTDKSQNFVGAQSGLFNNISGGHRWVISNLLQSKPKSPIWKNASGLLAGIIHLLEAVGGIRPTREAGSTEGVGYKGINALFTIAELRYNLTGMLGVVENDDTSSKLYASKAFNHWLRNGMSSLGNLITFRDLVKHVNRYIFHGVYPNPTPIYTSGTGSTTVSVSSSIFTDNASGKAALKLATKARDIIAKLYEEVSRTSLTVDLFDARSIVDDLVLQLRDVKTDDIKKVQTEANSAKAEIEAASSLSQVSGEPDTAQILDHLGGEKTSEGYTGGALSHLQKIISDYAKASSRTVKKRTLDVGDRLPSQLIFPETYFMAPPRCNVLFPDQITQLTFSRNYMRETTRLSCQGGMGFVTADRKGAKILNRHYFAPSLSDYKGDTLYATLEHGTQVILPHEVHSGIIPKFEWITAGQQWGARAAKETGRSEEVYKGGKVGYIQRLANFQFYQHRWLSRTMSVQCPYNPYMVIGLPGLVIDKPVPSTKVVTDVESQTGNEYLPTQFLGKVSTLSHNLDQNGGLTAISYTHCRTHRGTDDEFLQSIVREKTKKVRRKLTIDVVALASNTDYGKKRRNTYLVLVDKYGNNQLTQGVVVKGFGKIIKVKPSGDNVTLTDTQAETLAQSGEDTGPAFRTTAEDIGVTETASQTVTVPAFLDIQYEVSEGTKEFERVDTSVEDALMPSWYSSVWHKKNISEKVYLPILGTRAIIDDTESYGSGLETLVKKGGYSESGTPQRTDSGITVSESEVTSVGGKVEVTRLDIPTESIEAAVDGLAKLYGILREKELDVHEFIMSYIRRPIANMVEVLGSQNLTFTDGSVTDTNTMTEGFHSRAFGDYNSDVKFYDENNNGRPSAGSNALGDLLIPDNEESNYQPIIPRGTVTKLSPHLDPRGRARARVRRYVNELQANRGLFGY